MAVVLITGSNRGFGLEAALAFARNGDRVVATMRNPAQSAALRARAQAESLALDCHALDVGDSDCFAQVIEAVVQKYERIDVLVNNAGIHRAGALEDFDAATLRQIMEVNCIGPLLLTRAVLPHMRRQGSGLVIMMSSLSGVAGLPGDVPYSASKFALEGATEALRGEVDRWGIRVALVEAGMYATGIMDRNLDGSSGLPAGYPAASPYAELIRWQLAQLRQRLPDAFAPALVADLFVEIANSTSTQLRWPADAVATKVLETMLAQSDAERGKFLAEVAATQWWSRGDSAPTPA